MRKGRQGEEYRDKDKQEWDRVKWEAGQRGLVGM